MSVRYIAILWLCYTYTHRVYSCNVRIGNSSRGSRGSRNSSRNEMTVGVR